MHCCSPQNGHVLCLDGARLLRQPGRINGHQMRRRVQHLVDLLHGRIVGNIEHGRDVAHNPALGLEQVGIAQGFERFDRQQQTGTPARDQVAGNGLVGHPHESRHGTAALRHTMHLGLLHIEAGFMCSPVKNRSNGQHTLPADAGDDQIKVHALTTATSSLCALISLISLA